MLKIKRLLTSKTLWLCLISFFLGGISNPKIITYHRTADVPIERIVEVTMTPAPSNSPSPTSTNIPRVAQQSIKTQPPVAPRSAITLDKYHAIKDGMSYAEVVATLGVSGQETVRSSFQGEEMVMYQWIVGSGGASMNATFHNGKLTAKGQFGLK